MLLDVEAEVLAIVSLWLNHLLSHWGPILKEVLVLLNHLLETLLVETLVPCWAPLEV